MEGLYTVVNLHNPATIKLGQNASNGQRVGVIAVTDSAEPGFYEITASICSVSDMPKFNKKTAQLKAIGRLKSRKADFKFTFSPDHSNWLNEVVRWLRVRFGTTFLHYYPRKNKFAINYVRDRIVLAVETHKRTVQIQAQKAQAANSALEPVAV